MSVETTFYESTLPKVICSVIELYVNLLLYVMLLHVIILYVNYMQLKYTIELYFVETFMKALTKVICILLHQTM